MERSPEIVSDKNLYLLRNKSRMGMGFFGAGNFYPDYVMRIDTKDVGTPSLQLKIAWNMTPDPSVRQRMCFAWTTKTVLKS